jgi:DNA repair ATPase RecN
MHDPEMVLEHTKKLVEIDARSRSNTKRIDKAESTIEAIHEMNSNIKVIAEQTRQQGEELRSLVETLKVHEDKIENIEDKMETKDTVARLHERVDDLERKGGRDAEKMLGQIKWLLISLIIAGAGSFIWTSIS